jgi:hypothetical protein
MCCGIRVNVAHFPCTTNGGIPQVRVAQLGSARQIGRAKIRSFATTADAVAQVNACLRKRATAPRRIGVAYHVRRVTESLPPDQPTGVNAEPASPVCSTAIQL